MYDKPHLSYEKQLRLLEERGVTLTDTDAHIKALKLFGYYRLSAYFYPFREMIPVAERETPFNFRSNIFKDGTQFDHALALADFDSRLRKMLFEGLEIVEIALRTKIAYRAGRIDPLIHIKKDRLNEQACNKTIGDPALGKTAYSQWIEKYRTMCDQAKTEDFFQHFKVKYDDELPIWIAAEVFDFGGLSRLYNLLPHKLQSAIAKEFGVNTGAVFAGWVTSLNYMRNKVAHHSRLWNRNMTYALKTPHENQVNPRIRHLIGLGRDLNTVYDYMAVLTFLISEIAPEKRWNLRVKETMKKFPSVPDLTPESEMGFPEGWRELDLWK